MDILTERRDFLNRWLWYKLNTPVEHNVEISETEKLLVKLMAEEALEMPEEIVYDDSIPIKTRKERIAEIQECISNEKAGNLTKRQYIPKHSSLVECDTARGKEVYDDIEVETVVIDDDIYKNGKLTAYRRTVMDVYKDGRQKVKRSNIYRIINHYETDPLVSYIRY